MTATCSAAGHRRGTRTRSIRLALVLLASLLLHLIAFNWASGHIGLPSWHEPKEPVMTTELLPPPKKHIVAPHPPAIVAHRHKARPKPRPKPAAPPPPPQPKPVAAAAPTAPPAPVDAAPKPDVSDASPSTVAAPNAASPTPQPPQPAYRFNPPPSAELRYDVFALREAQKWYGSGKFVWQAGPDHYSITGEASIRFFFKITVLQFHSEGAIDDFGIEPLLYSEQPFHKPVASTHFQRVPGQHDGKIGFSASKDIYPYHDGAQDRASIIWQLAGIGRGNPGQFAPGAQIDVLVAGTRDAETWQIRVVGLEDIETDYGKMQAWHLTRTPQSTSHEKKIDIWLAPQHDWYPAKVRYTYDNGDYLDLSLSDLIPAAKQ